MFRSSRGVLPKILLLFLALYSHASLAAPVIQEVSWFHADGDSDNVFGSSDSAIFVLASSDTDSNDDNDAILIPPADSTVDDPNFTEIPEEIPTNIDGAAEINPEPDIGSTEMGLESIQDETNNTTNQGFLLKDGAIPLSDYIQFGEFPSSLPGKAPAEKTKYPTIVVSGCASIDAIWWSQDEANRAVVGDAQDTAGFRRSRLGALGNLTENVTYKMEYDFAFPGRPNFTDVWVDVGELPTGHFRVGQWKQPFGMEPATSFRELMFMERSLVLALEPFRQIGVGLYNQVLDQRATWAVSGYRFPTNVYGNVAGDNGYGMSTRETMLLYADSCNNVVHLGAGYTYNEPVGNTYRIRETPEVGFTSADANNVTDFPIPFFVDTGVLPCDSFQAFGAEFATGFGSMVFQSEYVHAVFTEPDGTKLNFPSAYAQVGYVLTGERRLYNKTTAAFQRVVPNRNFGKGGLGALEVAARYSTIDLNDLPVQGGYLQDITFGVSWYLNRYTRFEFNYIHPMLDRPIGNGTDADIFATRAQFDF